MREFAKKAFCVALVALSHQLAQAQIEVLTHNNSTASINTGSSAGMFNWTVDGQSPLFQQWFWFRVGNSGPEAAINTISAPSITRPDARTLYSGYYNGSYGVNIAYLLTGFSAGSGISDIAETITITNGTSSPLDFHFFQYSDFDLGGPGGDSVALSTNSNPFSPGFGKYNTATQIDPSAGLTETVATPGADRGEVGFYPNTLNKLNDGNTDNLSNLNGPIGPGDATWALQWDLTIPAYSSKGISKDKYLHIDIVPEPTSLALVGLGVLALTVRRKA